MCRALRDALDAPIKAVADNPTALNGLAPIIQVWRPSKYEAGDVRTDGGIPYTCIPPGHDSTGNPGWRPSASKTLWMQTHGTDVASARPWIAPTGAHNMYKAGECMIWTDDLVWRCVSDTVYSPVDYPQAWEVAQDGKAD
jgi:hypothetical protein